MNTVYIFGAGASKGGGRPQMNEFVEGAREMKTILKFCILFLLVIAAVLLILFYLMYVVTPLFLPAKISQSDIGSNLDWSIDIKNLIFYNGVCTVCKYYLTVQSRINSSTGQVPEVPHRISIYCVIRSNEMSPMFHI